MAHTQYAATPTPSFKNALRASSQSSTAPLAAISRRCDAETSGEHRCHVRLAREAYGSGDFDDAVIAQGEQRAGSRDPTPNDILMGRLSHAPPELSCEVHWTGVRDAGKIDQRQVVVEPILDEVANADQTSPFQFRMEVFGWPMRSLGQRGDHREHQAVCRKLVRPFRRSGLCPQLHAKARRKIVTEGSFVQGSGMPRLFSAPRKRLGRG